MVPHRPELRHVLAVWLAAQSSSEAQISTSSGALGLQIPPTQSRSALHRSTVLHVSPSSTNVTHFSGVARQRFAAFCTVCTVTRRALFENTDTDAAFAFQAVAAHGVVPGEAGVSFPPEFHTNTVVALEAGVTCDVGIARFPFLGTWNVRQLFGRSVRIVRTADHHAAQQTHHPRIFFQKIFFHPALFLSVTRTVCILAAQVLSSERKKIHKNKRGIIFKSLKDMLVVCCG